jgi:hypothetical protein
MCGVQRTRTCNFGCLDADTVPSNRFCNRSAVAAALLARVSLLMQCLQLGICTLAPQRSTLAARAPLGGAPPPSPPAAVVPLPGARGGQCCQWGERSMRSGVGELNIDVGTLQVRHSMRDKQPVMVRM